MNPDAQPGCFEEVHAGAGDQSWIKLICAIDTCMNGIEKNKQAFFHELSWKKDVKKVEMGKHICLSHIYSDYWLSSNVKSIYLYQYNDTSTDISQMLN